MNPVEFTFDQILKIIQNGNKPIKFSSVRGKKSLVEEWFRQYFRLDWSRRLVNIVCSNTGVWAVDDQGYVYFRHGHISASQNVGTYGTTFLPPAWISVPGEAKRHRFFVQIFCGPIDWMVI